MGIPFKVSIGLWITNYSKLSKTMAWRQITEYSELRDVRRMSGIIKLLGLSAGRLPDVDEYLYESYDRRKKCAEMEPINKNNSLDPSEVNYESP